MKSLLRLFLALFLPFAGFSQYCTPTFAVSCTSDDYIDLFTFNTLSNVGSGCNGNPDNYIFYTPAPTTTVAAGLSYSISMQSGPIFSQGFGVWADWNHDNDFADPGEFIYASPSAATTLFTGTVTVPATALAGATRLRVRCIFATTVVSTDDCSAQTFGETEDYTITVIPPPANDVGVSAIISPNNGCGLTATESVQVTINNYGTNPQTGFNVRYRINAGAIVTENIGATVIPPGGSFNYTFATPANLSVPGVYVFESWTELPTDGLALDDSTEKTVQNIPQITTYPYVQDFEGGPAGWTSGGTLNSWAFGTPSKSVIVGAHSGVNAWVTGGLGFSSYNSSEQSFVIGPCFNFTTLTNPWISMWINYESENFFDGAVLQASTDFGTTWLTIGNVGDPTNWYDEPTLIGSPGGAGFGWGGAFGDGSNGWIRAVHDLTGLAGAPAVRLRIAFGADGSVEYDGFAFDDVRIGNGPVPYLGPDQLFCSSDTIVLDGGAGYVTYDWSSGDTLRHDTITTPGTYYVTVSDTNGFFGSDTIDISISYPVVSLGPDTTICAYPGDSVTLIPTGTLAVAWLWNTGATSPTLTVGAAGVYYVTITDTVGCTDTDSILFSLSPLPVVNLGNDTTLCIGTSLMVDAGSGPPGTTYIWNTGVTTQVYFINTPGTYSVEVTSPFGCSTFDTIVITSAPNPLVSLGPDRNYCGPVTLDAGTGSGFSYLWNTGATTQSIVATAPGTYIATITNALGCSASDTVVLNPAPLPSVSLGPDQVICNGIIVPLDAGNPGSSYLWSTGATTQVINVTTAGLYYVTVTNASGCTASDTIEFTPSLLSVNLGPDRPVCSTNPIVLSAGTLASSYTWSTGATTSSIVVSTPGTYYVTITDVLGCTATDTVILSPGTPVVAGITAPSTGAILIPVNFTDASVGASSWNWSFGDGATSTLANPSHTYLAMGLYSVRLISGNGSCTDTTFHTININTFIGLDDALFAQALVVYPNPVSSDLHIEAELVHSADVQIEVQDLEGRTLVQSSLGDLYQLSYKVDMAGLPQGVYVLKVTIGVQTGYIKVIKS